MSRGPRNPRPITVIGDIGSVLLTRDHTALVDAGDAGWLSKWNWGALCVASNKVYARRNRLVDDGPGSSVILLHRAILTPTDGMEVDHIDGNSLNNRRSNLRLCSRSENMRNTKLRSDNTSGLKGAFWDAYTGRWIAAIGVNGKFKNLGRFDTAEEAHAVYCEAANEHFGEYARTT